MKKISLFLSLFFCLSIANANDDKFMIDENKYFDIIYTKNHITDAKFVKEHIKKLMDINDKLFGYKFDEKLTIILESNDKQVANAYSTQYPSNMGVYYNGGASMNNYFAHNSWLTTLLTHETIHNYQLNAKKSKISKFLKKYLGNNYMPMQVGAFFFTMPNIFLPTVLVEGNAVLNESLYQNGGRLYNGVFNAMKNSLLIYGDYTPAKFINNRADFPYGTGKYIIGGYFMKFLATKYGLTKTNRFFYAHSDHSINPWLLNRTFETHFGKGLEPLIDEFIKQTKTKHKNFQKLNVKESINRSKSGIELSKIDGKIYFITTNLKNTKELNIFDTKTKKLQTQSSSLGSGKIFKIDGKLYTNTSGQINPTQYKAGLFDDSRYILQSTAGKAIQEIHKDKISYVSISKSFRKTRLYIDKKFYANISSNAMYDNSGAIYYFKQQKSKRVLYKNKKAIYSMDGYFSKIVDIVDDIVYIVANTKHGSGLFAIKDGETTKLSTADNIVDAKTVSKTKFLASSIDENGYKVSTHDIIQTKAKPYFANITKKPLMVYDIDKKPTAKLDNKSYDEFSYLNWTNIYPIVFLSSDENSSYISITASFIDTKATSKLGVRYVDTHEEDIGLISYINQTNRLSYGVSVGFVDRLELNETIKQHNKENKKEYMANISVAYPLLKTGRHSVNTALDKYFDPDYKEKNPTVLKLSYDYTRQFAFGIKPHRQLWTTLYLKADRNNSFAGVDIKSTNHLFWNSYLRLRHKNIQSDTENFIDGRGVKVNSNPVEILLDETNFEATSLKSSLYAKDVAMSNIELSANLGLSWYLYFLPISIRDETVFVGQNIFDITMQTEHKFTETYGGISFDMLFGHTLAVPIVVKYIKNDIDDDSGKASISLGVRF